MGGALLPESVAGQYDDADADASAAGKPTAAAAPPATAPAPGGCATRSAAADAADAAGALRERLSAMPPALVAQLVRARASAAGLADAFPDGDQRFRSAESESEDDDAGVGEEDEEEDAEEEDCVGLLDARVDPGPRAALRRAAEEHGLDLVGEMRSAGLGFLARVRLANFVRRCVADGATPAEVRERVRAALEAGEDAGVLADDALLRPVLEGDVLLTVLEDADEEEDAREAAGVADAVRRCLLGDEVDDDCT